LEINAVSWVFTVVLLDCAYLILRVSLLSENAYCHILYLKYFISVIWAATRLLVLVARSSKSPSTKSRFLLQRETSAVAGASQEALSASAAACPGHSWKAQTWAGSGGQDPREGVSRGSQHASRQYNLAICENPLYIIMSCIRAIFKS
jgi:hypothetical protein